MERRVLLAVVLSFLFVVAFQMVTGQCSPKPQRPPGEPGAAPAGGPADSPGAVPAAGVAPGQPAPGLPAPGQPAAGQPAPGQPVPGQPVPVEEGPQAKVAPGADVTLESEELIAVFGNPGGCLKALLLKGAHDPNRKEPMVLVAPADLEHGLGGLDDQEVEPKEAPGHADRKDAPAGPLRRLSWTRDASAEAASPERDVVFRFVTADGRTLVKQWYLVGGPGRYDVRLRLSVKGRDAADRAPLPLRLLASGGVLAEEPTGTNMGVATDAVYRLASQKDVNIGHPFGFAPVSAKPAGVDADALALVGVRSQYFLVAAYAAPGLAPLPTTRIWATGEEAGKRDAMFESLRTWFREQQGRVAGDGQDAGLKRRLEAGVKGLLWTWIGLEAPTDPAAAPLELAFYAGPVAREVLRQEVHGPLASVITYPGGPDWLADVLLWIYDRWRLLLGSVGLAVILMTLTVRGLLMPLSIRNQLSMRRYGRKVQKLKPKLEALKLRFANNPQKLREETMLLYREHGVGFPAGCLMMLLQIPIFFALFASLRTEFTLRGAPFLWVPELSGPDRLFDLPAGFPLISSINLLPLLMVVLSVVQMRSMPKPMDPQQEQQMRMMKWMPILFAVILYNYTAALSLYMVVSSALALIESKIVKRRDEHDAAALSRA